MPRCWKRSAPNWTATIARGWKRSARRSDRVFRHAGLVPASNPPRAIALEARWTPEPVRGDGMSSGFLPLARRREPHLGIAIRDIADLPRGLGHEHGVDVAVLGHRRAVGEIGRASGRERGCQYG